MLFAKKDCPHIEGFQLKRKFFTNTSSHKIILITYFAIMKK